MSASSFDTWRIAFPGIQVVVELVHPATDDNSQTMQMRIKHAKDPGVRYLPMDLYLNVMEEDCWSVIDRTGTGVPMQDVKHIVDSLSRRDREATEATSRTEEALKKLSLAFEHSAPLV